MVTGLLKRWRVEGGDTRLLGLVRSLLGLLLLGQAITAGRELQANGYFGDYFHLAFLPEWLVPSRAVYCALISAQVLLATLVLIGHAARSALFVTASIGIFLLLCDRLAFHHNRYALFCYAWLLSFSPCDQSVVLGMPPRRSPSQGLLWAARLTQLQCTLIYLASGGSKLLDADWRTGRVLFDRLARNGQQALDRGVPAKLVEVLSRPDATGLLARIAIASELALAVGLWIPRTRVIALWWGLWFHLTIELTSKVEGFTWLTLAIYALFATHDGRARKLRWDPRDRRSRVVARLIRGLDWLSRFDAAPWTADGVPSRHPLIIFDRDGSRRTGAAAIALVARTCPLVFPLWGPVALLAFFAHREDTPESS